MKERVRERIALVVLIALVALAGSAIIAYFAFGRSWSVAATIMDDAVGRMNGYTALVFNAGDSGSGVVGLSGQSAARQAAASVSDKGSESIRQSEAPADTDTIGLRIMAYYTLANPYGLQEVDPQAVVDLYEEKDTNVAILDVAGYGVGSAPEVIEVGDKKIGVFYAVGYKSNSQIAKITDRLRDDGAEAIICITPRLETLQSTVGIHAVLVQDVNDDLAGGSTRSGDTLITAVPSSGKVGVILFSSNNMATARVIDAL